MERNRRIAKAYARKHALTINGSQDDYLDGTTLGLNSFHNPDRDAKTSHIKQYIGQGIRVRINQNGDIFVKRLSKANVFFHQLHHRESITDVDDNHERDKPKGSQSSSDLYADNSDFYGVIGGGQGRMTSGQNGGKQSNQHGSNEKHSSSGASSSSSTNNNNNSCMTSVITRLELEKLVKVFDMQKFKVLLEREARRPYPNRIQLRNMCISVISFVLDDKKLLNLPSWIMVINIVALDLVRREIGLVDPHDMLGPSQTPHIDDYQLDLDYEFYNNHKKHSNMPHLSDSNRQLTASKRAFANAAASGAYNGDYYSASYDNYNDFQNEIPRREETKVGKLNEVNEDIKRNTQINNTHEARQQQQQRQQHLMSSSSSGFNSHCSSHNDSSAASSRSNIAAPTSSGDLGQPITTKPSMLAVDESSTPSAEGVPLKAGRSGSCIALNCNNLLPASPLSPLTSPPVPPPKNKSRGSRPPKLPHGLAPPGGQNSAPNPTISSPIPIPVPPTGAGGPATGRANLILVSPTGLSPPLTKRKGLAGSTPIVSSVGTSDPVSGGGRYRRLAPPAPPPSSSLAPEFGSIKYVDENGYLLDKSLQERYKLPAGIPAHAQLAPPATRKHILRYLMSAASADMKKPAAQVPRRQQQRPLPVLPFQKVAQQARNPLVNYAGGYMIPKSLVNRSDESLYYCGLQARVPNHRHRPMPVPVPMAPSRQPAPIYPITKSAINAILTDFKLNQLHNRLHARNAHHQQGSFVTNLAKNSTKFMSLDNINQSSLSSSSSDSANAKSPGGLQSGGQLGDNIHNVNYSSPHKSSSFLNHVGGFLKRSKVKKSSLAVELK